MHKKIEEAQAKRDFIIKTSCIWPLVLLLCLEFADSMIPGMLFAPLPLISATGVK